jgi:hypothetical protein
MSSDSSSSDYESNDTPINDKKSMRQEIKRNVFFRDVCKKILQYLQSKEKEDPKRWVHHEFDSNLTNFEHLSNQHVIGFSSSLSGKKICVLMAIFQSLFDHNYWLIEEFVSSPEFDEEMTGRQLFYLFCRAQGISDKGQNFVVTGREKIPMVYTYPLLFNLF